MKKLLFATCLLIACQGARAGQSGAGNGPSVTVTPASGGSLAAFVPQKKSVFTGSENDHNPFWPIGWTKMEAVATDSGVNPRVDDFTVSTILLNDPPMAVINGKDMAEGEVASLTLNSGQSAMVQLMAVEDGRVILRWQNQNLTIPIHRQEDLTQANAAP